MPTCPFCMKAVPEGVTICPHDDCRKTFPVSGSAGTGGAVKRPPPPPGRTQASSGSPPSSAISNVKTLRPVPGPPSGTASSGAAPATSASPAKSRLPPPPVKISTVPAPNSRPSTAWGAAEWLRHPGAGAAGSALLILLCLVGWGVHHALSSPSELSAPRDAATPASVPEEQQAAKQPASPAGGNSEVMSSNDSGRSLVTGRDTNNSQAIENKQPPKLQDLSVATGLFVLRTEPRRDQMIGVYGATPQSEAAVQAGLDWLARHQAEDGHWGPDCLKTEPDGRCQGGTSCGGPGSDYPIAQTGLALLAFQAGGHYDFNDQKYSAAVRSGLDWLIKNQHEDGRFATHLASDPEMRNYMYDHGIAAFAMSEACAVALAANHKPKRRFLLAAKRSVRFIEQQQHPDGGWRYPKEHGYESDTSVSGWQALALKTAKQAKINVSKQCLHKVEQFFKSCELGGGRTAYMASGRSLGDATTGIGMLVHEFILETPGSSLVKEGAQYLANQANLFDRNQGNFYTWYNCTLAMFQPGGETWKRWNDVVRDLIVRRQRQEPRTCLDGSWDPNTYLDDGGGRIYSTALAVLTLEVYYRYQSERARVYVDVPSSANNEDRGRTKPAGTHAEVNP